MEIFLVLIRSKYLFNLSHCCCGVHVTSQPKTFGQSTNPLICSMRDMASPSATLAITFPWLHADHLSHTISASSATANGPSTKITSQPRIDFSSANTSARHDVARITVRSRLDPLFCCGREQSATNHVDPGRPVSCNWECRMRYFFRCTGRVAAGHDLLG